MTTTRMTEAEVSLRLAIHLASSGRAENIEVALDGAQIKTGTTEHFNPHDFLLGLGWEKKPDETLELWRGEYVNTSIPNKEITVHSNPGVGDVTAIYEGKPLIVESKKGKLKKCSSSSEYKLLREALGQILTIIPKSENKWVLDDAILAVAVPDGERFIDLAERWREAPLVKRAGIRILTVSPDGKVSGW